MAWLLLVSMPNKLAKRVKHISWIRQLTGNDTLLYA